MTREGKVLLDEYEIQHLIAIEFSDTRDPLWQKRAAHAIAQKMRKLVVVTAQFVGDYDELSETWQYTNCDQGHDVLIGLTIMGKAQEKIHGQPVRVTVEALEP